jgi:predicted DNA-binding transcriptional regulator AlpA
MSTDNTAQHWYTTEQLAALVHIDPSTLRRWRTASPPEGPAFVRLSARNVIYSRADVQSWLEARRVEAGPAA